MIYYSDYSDENDNDDHDRGEFYSFHHYKKKNIIQQVLLQKKKIMEVMYILLHLYVVFCCNGNLNFLHQYEIVAIIIMLH